MTKVQINSKSTKIMAERFHNEFFAVVQSSNSEDQSFHWLDKPLKKIQYEKILKDLGFK